MGVQQDYAEAMKWFRKVALLTLKIAWAGSIKTAGSNTGLCRGHDLYRKARNMET